MLSLGCPSCGASVTFHSKASVFAVCSFCKSSLVRHDMDLESIGVMADLQDDYTPFQIGTKGVYESKKFELVGRLRVGYADGAWNEWLAWFEEDNTGWLAEAQGFLAMCFSAQSEQVPSNSAFQGAGGSFQDPTGLLPGRTMTIKSKSFVVEDMRRVQCIYSEGELPMHAAKGRRSYSVDLTGPAEMMATIEYAEPNEADPSTRQPRVFVGTYQDFDEFKFTNLRKLDGW